MENLLLKYMIERFNEDIAEKEETSLYPFLTISRQHGCDAGSVAEILSEQLNKKIKSSEKEPKWQIISKEILESASTDLNVHIGRVQEIFSPEKRGAIEEVLKSFGKKYYKSDRWVLHSIANVIRNFALHGNVIIIGRGGVAVTKDLPKGLHIRLDAPIKWRVSQIIKQYNIKNNDQAFSLINEVDKSRAELLKKISKGKFDITDFDIIYNSMYFTPKEIADSIIYHMETKIRPSLRF